MSNLLAFIVGINITLVYIYIFELPKLEKETERIQKENQKAYEEHQLWLKSYRNDFDD